MSKKPVLKPILLYDHLPGILAGYPAVLFALLAILLAVAILRPRLVRPHWGLHVGRTSFGWAGVSLFSDGEERVFVGDPNGQEEGWALHPAGYNARHACPLLEGKTTVTLRYDYRSGLAQLFEGTDTSGPALASEWIAPGLHFDRIRIANGSQADGALDAGKPASAAGSGDDVHIRGDIAIRRIRVRVLSSERASVTGS